MTDAQPRRSCVLAIDNSDDVRDLYRELLGDGGYDVVTFGCHEARLDAMRQVAPDVVLLDCFLGCDPSGWELLQVLSLDPVLQRVPVVICTTDARVSGGDDRQAIREGIQVLPKPFDVQELLNAVAVALQPSETATAD